MAQIDDLKQQQQIAKLRGRQDEVDRLQEQIDSLQYDSEADMNREPTAQPVDMTQATAPDEGASTAAGESAIDDNSPKSVADMVAQYEDKKQNDPDQDSPAPADDIQRPTMIGETNEITHKAPPGSPAPQAPQYAMGKAPTYKSSYVPIDYSKVGSLKDLLSDDKDARAKAREAEDARAAGAMDEANRLDKEAIDLYKAGKTKNEWLDVGERVAHALAQFGAARQGLSSNVDLSGLKFDKHDYGKDTDRLMKEMRQTLASTKDKRSMAERLREKNLEMGEHEADKTLGAQMAGREEERKMAEDIAKGQSRSTEEENRFAQESYRTGEAARSRVDAAKARQEARQDTDEWRRAMAEQARQDRLDREGRAREERTYRDAAKAAEKTEASRTKAISDLDGAVELIGDSKTRTKGEQQLSSAAARLGATKQEQQDLIELSKSPSIGERVGSLFGGEDKKTRLNKALEALKSRATGAKTPSETPAGQTSATPATPLSAQDAQALAWAKANPNDPRAAAIMQRLQGR